MYVANLLRTTRELGRQANAILNTRYHNYNCNSLDVRVRNKNGSGGITESRKYPIITCYVRPTMSVQCLDPVVVADIDGGFRLLRDARALGWKPRSTSWDSRTKRETGCSTCPKARQEDPPPPPYL